MYFHLKNVETSAKVVLRFNVTMLKSLLLVIPWDCPFLSLLDFIRLWVCTLWFSWFLILFNNLHSVNHLIPWIFHITEPVLPSLFSFKILFFWSDDRFLNLEPILFILQTTNVFIIQYLHPFYQSKGATWNYALVKKFRLAVCLYWRNYLLNMDEYLWSTMVDNHCWT